MNRKLFLRFLNISFRLSDFLTIFDLLLMFWVSGKIFFVFVLEILRFQIFRFSDFFVFFSKLLILLLKVTKVTTERQKWPKMGQNRIISSLLPKGKKSLGQRPKPSAGARSRLA